MKNGLNETDKILLEALQKDFPLVSKPFDLFAGICGITEDEVIQSVERLISDGVIREISAIFNAVELGYKSTLVALSAPAGSEDRIAGIINTHPGVSHNYYRDYKYNIWFTITIMEETDFEEELQKMLENVQDVEYLILPSIRTFKIGVNFKLRDSTESPKADNKKPEPGKMESSRAENIGSSVSRAAHVSISGHTEAPVKGISSVPRGLGLSEGDKKIILKLQEQMKIVERPWKEKASGLGMDENRLLDHIKDLKDRGAIKRISAVLRHRRVGYTANGMACFNINEEKIEQAGKILAQYPEVSHCYQRKTYPDWKYGLFAMVHCRSEDECRTIAFQMSKKIGCSDHIVLFSTKEYKKERVKYFME
jgi:DNA-binding Lrp family transcriptional regulator